MNGPGIIWEGKGLDEVGRRADTNEIVIKIDPRYFRPSEVDQLLGDSKKAYQKLGWIPEMTLEDIIEEMINVDKNKALEESLLLKKGFKISAPQESPPNS